MLTLALLAACQGSGIFQLDGAPVAERPPLSLAITTPSTTAFVGGDTTLVSGTVTPTDALVWVEGRAVNVGLDGAFSVELPLRGPYRIIDIEAADGRTSVREIRTALAGSDPLAAWPGAVSVVLTPTGLVRAVGDLGVLVDSLGWSTLIADTIPGVTVSHLPTSGGVTATDSGLDFDVTIRGLELTADLLGTPVTLGWDTVELGLLADVDVDTSGLLALSFGEPVLTLGELNVDAFDIDIPLLEDLIDGGLDGLTELLVGIIDLVVTGLELPVPLPLDLDLDLLGTSVSTSVAAADVTSEGVVLVLGVGIDGPPGDAGAVAVPPPDPWHPDADLLVGVHEGLFQLVLASDLLDLVDLDSLQLDGFLANILTLPLQGLPGGAILPEADGWCIGVDPGEARVARMPGGTAPLAALYLPELAVDIGYSTSTAQCQPWLQATIATEILLIVEDKTRIGVDLVVADGTVTYYASELPWDEDGVVSGLGNILETVLDLLGGSLDFDLSDLAGTGASTGLLPALAPAVLESEPLFGPDGRPLDGLHGITLSLFD